MENPWKKAGRFSSRCGCAIAAGGGLALGKGHGGVCFERGLDRGDLPSKAAARSALAWAKA
jgi:hypothetical protein